MAHLDHVAGAGLAAGEGDLAVGRGLDGRPEGGGVVDAVVRPVDLVDRVQAAGGEPGGDPGELDRRAQEVLAPRAAGLVEIIGRFRVGIGVAISPVGAPLVDELGGQDVAVAGETAVEIALLDEDAVGVALAQVGVEIDVPAEAALDEVDGQGVLLAGLVQGGDEAVFDGSGDQDGLELDRHHLHLGPDAVLAAADDENAGLVDVVLQPPPGALGEAGQAQLLAGPDAAEVVDRLDRFAEVVDLPVGEAPPLEEVGQVRAGRDGDLLDDERWRRGRAGQDGPGRPGLERRRRRRRENDPGQEDQGDHDRGPGGDGRRETRLAETAPRPGRTGGRRSEGHPAAAPPSGGAAAAGPAARGFRRGVFLRALARATAGPERTFRPKKSSRK